MNEEFLCKGHTACAGCAPMVVIRHVLKAAGKNTIIANATSCSEIVSSRYPTTAWSVPYIHVAFECTAAVASGIEAALKQQNKDANVIAIAGDGGTADIGLQSLSGMVDRGHNVLYVCYTNESYANTGVQRSSATPYAAWTTTTPVGKKSFGNTTFQKPIAEMIAAQGAPYVATASVAYPKDIQAKVKKALSIKGPKFLLIHAPCTIGWKFLPQKSIEIAKLAVESGLWVVYEIENGRMKINMKPKNLGDVEAYLKLQGRFSHLTDKEIMEIKNHVIIDWKKYEELEKAGVRI